jgi:hypothetical protein
MNTVVALMLLLSVLLMTGGFVAGWIGGRRDGLAEGRSAERRSQAGRTRSERQEVRAA